ncbi:MAG: hypothetical protein K2Z81_19720, partial [Cyanobacteria bacterium]|nr:hypothetical protein [Cyanobacteriota bacterium]
AFNDDARNQTAQQGGGSSALPKLVNMFSSALLGMPMGGGFAGQMANMGANMAMGPAMNGFSGVRMRQRDQVQQEPEPKQPPSRPEDPAIFEAAPPPSDAKLLTKVGWCEVRIFGQTSPALHLPERLEKLNTELNFEPGKQGMWLMDHVDALLEAVQSRSSTIGMKPETTTTTTTEKKDDDYNEADTLQ